MPPLLIISYDLEQTVLILSEQCLILHTFLIKQFNWTILMISVKRTEMGLNSCSQPKEKKKRVIFVNILLMSHICGFPSAKWGQKAFLFNLFCPVRLQSCYLHQANISLHGLKICWSWLISQEVLTGSGVNLWALRKRIWDSNYWICLQG